MKTDRSAWILPLFLALGVLAPTACVFWFMNALANSQGDAARRSVTEAWRGQMRLMRESLDFFWTDRAAALDAVADAGTGVPALVRRGLADSGIQLGEHDAILFPAPMAVPRNDPALGRAEWSAAEALERRPERLAEASAAYARLAQTESNPSLAARAEQAYIRCLVRTGNRETALRAILTAFSGGRPRGLDLQRRLIGADEHLLALHLLKRTDVRFVPTAERLAALLNDYDAVTMPSAQRLFLMGEFSSLAPGLARFPMQEAERLAGRFLDAEGARAGDRALSRSRLSGVWKFTSANGRLIALYRTATLQTAMGAILARQTRSHAVNFSTIPPGEPAPPEAIAAGATMPGWQISFSLADSSAIEEAARRRIASSLWIGYLVMAAIALSGLLVGQSIRRQTRLARLKTDLVAAVSHEIKTPLAAMRLLVDCLRDEETPDPARTRDYLELMAGENLRLTRLIENFLTFSRIERNRQQFHFVDTSVADVVEAAVTAMGDRVREPACKLAVEITPGLPCLAADRDALVTVLINLLDNACKYTAGEKRISVTAGREEGGVVLAVRDSGIGIAPREQKRIFRRFYQVDQRLARETGGCGLGLSIVEFIVQAHGGTVRVSSQPGAGSTFTVTLPLPGKGRRAA